MKKITKHKHDIFVNFVRSGSIELSTTAGTFRVTGNAGYYWSLHATSTTTHAYLLAIYVEVNPLHSGNRYGGIPLRCLSTVLDI